MNADRDEYVGTSLRPLVKHTLRVVAAHSGKSLSLYVSDLIEAHLKEIGAAYEPVDPGPKLPFEKESIADA